MWKILAGVCLAWLAFGAVKIAPCAQENGTCSLSRSAWVVFGSDGKYSVRQVANGTPCTNAVFGDPNNGVAKACYAIPASARFNKCAADGGVCSFNGVRLVIFGAGPDFAGRLLSNTAACGKATFGDPAPNRPKTCMVLSAELSLDAPPAPLSATYATLQMKTGSNQFLKLLPGGVLATDVQERVSYFVLLADHSPPVSGDVIRLGDFTGQLALTMQPNGTLAMARNLPASGAALRMTSTPTPAGLAVDLQVPDKRFLVLDGNAFGLQKTATPTSTMNIRFFTRAQVNQEMAKGQALEEKSARPQFGQGVN